ncbi:hypothetical protein NFI96_003084 [Prochilodus magdalenae]|nr:hypothetical protein NFI96_003084 [Prochilodus magdalenae]
MPGTIPSGWELTEALHNGMFPLMCLGIAQTQRGTPCFPAVRPGGAFHPTVREGGGCRWARCCVLIGGSRSTSAAEVAEFALNNGALSAEDLLPPGFPNIDMGPQLKVVERTRTANMLCAASGNPDPEITWFKDFLPIDPSTSNGRIKQLRSALLSISRSSGVKRLSHRAVRRHTLPPHRHLSCEMEMEIIHTSQPRAASRLGFSECAEGARDEGRAQREKQGERQLDEAPGPAVGVGTPIRERKVVKTFQRGVRRNVGPSCGEDLQVALLWENERHQRRRASVRSRRVRLEKEYSSDMVPSRLSHSLCTRLLRLREQKEPKEKTERETRNEVSGDGRISRYPETKERRLKAALELPKRRSRGSLPAL